jgi:hypothetical protein
MVSGSVGAKFESSSRLWEGASSGKEVRCIVSFVDDVVVAMVVRLCEKPSSSR